MSAVGVATRQFLQSERGHVLRTLMKVETSRLLRHPALPLGLVGTALFGRTALDGEWAGAAYTGMPAAIGPMLLGISVASGAAFARDRDPLAEDAPLGPGRRAVARLLAGAPVVAVVAVLVAVGAVWLRAHGGLDLGNEPGRTLHAHFTLPELLQPIVLAAFAVAFGAAATTVIRHRLAATVAMFVAWFAVSGAYWLFNGPAATAFSVIQVQPLTVPVGPPSTDPLSFPSSWLLSAPGAYQDYWGRVVVSPAMAAWHDVYLVGLTLLAAAVATRGRTRRSLAVAGLVVAVVGAAAQKMVQP